MAGEDGKRGAGEGDPSVLLAELEEALSLELGVGPDESSSQGPDVGATPPPAPAVGDGESRRNEFAQGGRSVTPVVTRAVTEALATEERFRNRRSVLPTRAQSSTPGPRAATPPAPPVAPQTSLRFPVFGARSPFSGSRKETRFDVEAQRLAGELRAVDEARGRDEVAVGDPVASRELDVDLDGDLDRAEAELVRARAAEVERASAGADSVRRGIDWFDDLASDAKASVPESRSLDLLELDDPLSGPSSLEDDDPDGSEAELRELRERVERRDWLGALRRAQSLLEREPDHGLALEVLRIASENAAELYSERLGGRRQVFRVVMSMSEIADLQLDPRAGFVIMLLDGSSTVEDILDMSGMDALDVLRLLFELKQQGVVDDA